MNFNMDDQYKNDMYVTHTHWYLLMNMNWVMLEKQPQWYPSRKNKSFLNHLIRSRSAQGQNEENVAHLHWSMSWWYQIKKHRASHFGAERSNVVPRDPCMSGISIEQNESIWQPLVGVMECSRPKTILHFYVLP